AAVQRLLCKGRNVWLLHRSGGFEQFRNQADLLGISDRVIATDAVHPCRDLFQDYRASDICVQGSRAEGLGFSPLEALACGIPVNWIMCGCAVTRLEVPASIKDLRRTPRLALVCDFAEENWVSMDLVGLMLGQGLREYRQDIQAFRLCPVMERRFTTIGHSDR